MVLVIGGFAQGKLEFAKNELGVGDYSCGNFESTECIYNLQDMVLDENFNDDLDKYIKTNPECVIICNEVGGGIVPLDEDKRMYREKVGSICKKLAKQADSVYRVFCGIGMKIK